MDRKKSLKTYIWQAFDDQGQPIRGEQHAINETFARLTLYKQGIFPHKVRKKLSFSFNRYILRARDITLFTRQMATMLDAGIPLIQALNLLGQNHANTAYKNMIHSLKTTIEAGSSVTEALERQTRYFNNFYRSLIYAGEQSGKLTILLERIAVYREKTELIILKIKKALFYPVTILFIAGIVVAVMLVFVVPEFQTLFANFGATLPIPTRLVIALSYYLQSSWWMIIASIAISLTIFTVAKQRLPRFAYWLEKCSFRFPILGTVLKKTAIARFSRTLSTTFSAGLPLLNALTIVAGATGSGIYNKAALQIHDAVMAGQSLHKAMYQTSLFPNIILQLIVVGEESGALSSMLDKAADIFEKEVDAIIDNFSNLLEPLIMALLGLLVGGLVIALYLPIFQLGSIIK
jgi:type IV pilus assembly protein PilC